MTTEPNPADLEQTLAAADEVQRRTEAARDQLVIDFKWLMAHKQGRRIMWWLLSQCSAFHNARRQGANDTYFALGVQNVGQMLIAESLSIAPDQFFNMMKECNDDGKRPSSGSRS
jgi:hypothetical protein